MRFMDVLLRYWDRSGFLTDRWYEAGSIEGIEITEMKIILLTTMVEFLIEGRELQYEGEAGILEDFTIILPDGKYIRYTWNIEEGQYLKRFLTSSQIEHFYDSGPSPSKEDLDALDSVEFSDDDDDDDDDDENEESEEVEMTHEE